MPSFVTPNFSHDYNGIEVLEIYENYYYNDDMTGQYTFYGNVDGKLNIYLDESIAKILKKYVSCGSGTPAGSSNIGDRTLEVHGVEAYTYMCADEFSGTAWDATLGKGNARYDMSGSRIGNYALNKFMKSKFTDQNRVDWFGDSADTDADYKQYDGFFKYLTDRAIVPSGQYIDLNDPTYQTSGTLAADAALNLFKAITSKSKADVTLRQMPIASKTIHVTGELFDNYLTTLENLGNETGQSNLENGLQTVKFRGLTVVRRDDWDQWLEDPNNPYYSTLTANGGHICLYTIVPNLVVGSDIGLGNSNIEMWYDKKDQKLYTRSTFRRGTTYVHGALMSIAY